MFKAAAGQSRHACSVGLFVSMTPAAFAWPLVQRQGHELSLAWLSFEPTAVPKTASVKLHLRTLCLVCKDGSQDPTTENATNFARTEALREAPAPGPIILIRSVVTTN